MATNSLYWGFGYRLVLILRADSIPYSLGEWGNGTLVRFAGEEQLLNFDVADLVIVDCVWVV